MKSFAQFKGPRGCRSIPIRVDADLGTLLNSVLKIDSFIMRLIHRRSLN